MKLLLRFSQGFSSYLVGTKENVGGGKPNSENVAKHSLHIFIPLVFQLQKEKFMFPKATHAANNNHNKSHAKYFVMENN